MTREQSLGNAEGQVTIPDEKGEKMMFKVQIVSAGGVRHDLYGELTEREAIDFCEENNWHYLDENRFEWALDYVEDYERG